ncbi:hypothetical protein CJ030_MR8G014199 [Morella rubra]|uniref:non-specific serine/threonine protein kinase n=1 Tax=Morella rubra TaxID=262757 RepID=A0A6A1UZ44_9ROSI|nr:hypothetical protein CJ030_MR8G014199 [Morella rubra]
MGRTRLLILLLVSLLLVSFGNGTFTNLTTDQSALLALKAQISYDPHGVSNDWSLNTSVCNWKGVTCDSRNHRVEALSLFDMGLEGTLPPHLGNLSYLGSLNISNNSFHGPLPNELARLDRLEVLDFGFNKFSEEIPSWIGLLSKLQFLSLKGNSFTGTIPSSLSNTSSLQIIDFGLNQLSGSIPSFIFNISTLKRIRLEENGLSGPMPSIIFDRASLQEIVLTRNKLSGVLPLDMFDHLPNLRIFRVAYNKLSGKFTSALFNCTQLQYLALSVNNFTGTVPHEIGNLTMLTTLYLADNNYEGTLPSEIGNLPTLEWFSVSGNNFRGPIPFQIFNISTIQLIEMSFNKLSGYLPSDIGLFLPKLRILHLGANKLIGTIPSSISNATELTKLELAGNSFSGSIPITLGSLRLLQRLNLGFNNLTIGSPESSFFSSLSNCLYLRVLILTQNPLNIRLPSSFGNLSTSLDQFHLSNCNIKGSIPGDMGNLSSLTIINLVDNELVGSIPTALGRLHLIEGIWIDANMLTGPIPAELCSLKRLVELSLGGNKLSGQIPACLDNLTSVRHIYLGFNQLTSTIPSSMWSLAYLLELNLSSNSLSGSLSLNIGNLKVLTKLDLSKTQLSGDIPTTIGALKDLVHLSLAGNRLEGSIPESLGGLLALEFLDLSNNKISGEIPKSLEALVYLKYLNVSFNRLQGEIPRGGPFVNFSAASFLSNDALCGAPRLQVSECKSAPKKKETAVMHILKFVLPASVLMLIAVATALGWTRRTKRNVERPIEEDLPPTVIRRRISHLELLQATGGFGLTNLLGWGSFGSVYRGALSDGMIVAVKVLNLQVEGAFKSFDAECEILRSISHRNLIKIITVCSSIDFKAFVLEYMPNGNLEKWLYNDDQGLTFLQRLNIMIDVASALEYLHWGYLMPIVHCDLKPSNVLFDEDMVAHVADFGISKILSLGDSMTRTMALATIGYMAPEYGSEGIISTKGDVYSYGILLMETFTRKKPTDAIFTGELSLKHWVEESLVLSVIEIVDDKLLENRGDSAVFVECVSSIMRLALQCCEESPKERITIKSASITLKKIKLKFLGDV